LEEPIQISTVVVREFSSRWSSLYLCFRVRKYLVPFSVLDVCIFLGLGVVGEEVNFEDCVPSLVNQLFEHNNITVNMIIAKLSDNTINREEKR